MSRSTSEDGGDILLAPGLEHGAAHADHHDRHKRGSARPRSGRYTSSHLLSFIVDIRWDAPAISKLEQRRMYRR